MYPIFISTLGIACAGFMLWGAYLCLFRRDRRKAPRTAGANDARMRRRSDKAAELDTVYRGAADRLKRAA